ncbi:MAG TPA: DUF1214 domain-containing protein [Thermoanaerobaculia bacterium]|jgi:hypothetical protein
MNEKQDVPEQQLTAENVSRMGAFSTTVAYVAQFYPLWFTYNQSRFATHNRLVGPDQVTPLYQIVVAINVDTLYASTFLNLAAEPVVLTIPATTVTYSILTLDPYGVIIQSNIPKATPGTYAFTGPGFTGTLPAGMTAVAMPLNVSVLIFRADKFSSGGQDQTSEAGQFRASLKLQALSGYVGDPSGGAAMILPEVAFAIPYKTIADTLITKAPITFLKGLQTAVASSNTPAMPPAVKALSDHFNGLFGDGGANPSELSAGARAAHESILDRYLTHTGPTNWITFTNIGAWGHHVVERASITEFIQYGNGHSTAAYYHAFKDATGVALDGDNQQGYVLTFSAGQIPQAQRFWSVTAYTPDSIELIENSANKYEVASYEPGLQTQPDGSISIYIATELPSGVPMANWLPVADGRFNVMLRVYGPEGSVASNTYVPPGIQRNQ